MKKKLQILVGNGTGSPEKNEQNNKGITLVALIITIIILLILVGVSVSIMLNSGIIGKSSTATESYAKAQAKEKLELALSGAQTEKYTNAGYNLNEYINNEIPDAIIKGDIVTVDGYNFKINRSIPNIEASLGKANLQENIKIEISQEKNKISTVSTITIKLTYTGEIYKVIVGSDEIDSIGTKDSNNMYTITYDVTDNGTYTIVAYNDKDEYNYADITIDNLVEDIEIRTVKELQEFCYNVNNGDSYNDKIITLVNNIDLRNVCGEGIGDWTPIGTSETPFNGIFEGNNKEINNIYINTSSDYQGLFGCIGSASKIENLTVNGSITAGQYVGGVVGRSWGEIVNCINKANVTGGIQFIGGICGQIFENNVESCMNEGSITSNSDNATSVGGVVGACYKSTMTKCANIGAVSASGTNNYAIGGIAGLTNSDGQLVSISQCSNTAQISSTNTVAYGGIGGIVGYSVTIVNISHCYNIGNVTITNCYTNASAGGINGRISNGGDASIIEYCYNKGAITATGTSSEAAQIAPHCDLGTLNIIYCYALGSYSADYGGVYTRYGYGNASNCSTTLEKASTLNSASSTSIWKDGTAGYPVFKWQK